MFQGLRRIAAPALGLALACAAAAEAQTTVVLMAYTSGSFRWCDAIGYNYSAAYRSSYSYTQAMIAVTYNPTGVILTGSMVASNLKPNFAYQFKLTGVPESYPASNEQLGFAGRWWEQVWDGAAWSAGWNLNDKGTGYAPNPNDVVYLARRDVTNATSPTGRSYLYTGYRPLDYFITDEHGSASLQFSLVSAYHVLWRTNQASPDPVNDGPVKSRTFDPDPDTQPQYETDYSPATVGVFGEWERLPAGAVYLAPGTYDLDFLITEECFHAVDGAYSGYWAHAAHGPAHFTVVLPTIAASVSPSHGGAASPSGVVTVACGAATGVTFAAANYWVITNVVVNGQSHGATNAWTFARVTNDQTVVAQVRPLLASNAVPRWWLAQRNSAWTNDFDGAAGGDPDGDGMATWQEYLAGTDPTNRDSAFRIAVQAVMGGTNVLTWLSPCSDPSLPPFGVERSTNLAAGWVRAMDVAPRSGDGTNVWRDRASPAVGPAFYRVVATNF